MSTRQEMRSYLIGMLDQDKAPRLAPAFNAVRRLLMDHEWHSYTEVRQTALNNSDLLPGTVDAKISTLIQVSMIEKKGKFGRRKGSRDTRQLRLITWPRSL